MASMIGMTGGQTASGKSYAEFFDDEKKRPPRPSSRSGVGIDATRPRTWHEHSP
jgi:hypothetical protein